ncbi:hypothetical protein [Methylocella sp.]|uniref:hypothetical protein n=1 Tax=Methylocella sp. TaxID=1978226 RepID=UPI0035B0772A
MSDLLRSAMPTPEIDSFMSAVSQAYDLSEDQINRLFLGKKQEKTGESPDLSLTPASSKRIMAAKEKLIEFMIKIRSENDHKNSETRRYRRFYVIIGVSVLFVIAVVVITIILSDGIAVLFLGNWGVAATYIGFLIVALRQQTLWHRLDINAQLS